jgi:hypothetical protein
MTKFTLLTITFSFVLRFDAFFPPIHFKRELFASYYDIPKIYQYGIISTELQFLENEVYELCFLMTTNRFLSHGTNNFCISLHRIMSI